jgi:tetratricopeptide (TPR) repeat protein
MGISFRNLALLSAFCVFAVPAAGLAQLGGVDPDANTKGPRPKPKPKSDPLRSDLADENALDDDDPVDEPVKKNNLNAIDPDAKPRPKPSQPEATPAPVVAPKKKGAKTPEPPPEPVKPKYPPLIVNRAGDAELEAAWDRWRSADASKDPKAEAQARAALKALKGEVGAAALEPYAMGFVRASRVHEKAEDATGAIELALSAVELAPELPSAHFGLAQAYFDADPAEVGRWMKQFGVAAEKALRDPRYLRPMLADFGSGALYALVATAIAVTAVLFIRRARYYLYDIHWFFPRVVARWQSVAVGMLLVLSPLLLRSGVVPVLLVLFVATALYMTVPERAVTAVAIGMLGAVPVLAGQLVDTTTFSGSAAERVWTVETGGPGAEAQARELTRLAVENQASFAELAALGTFELRRGKLDLAITHLKAALDKKNDQPQATNNLAVAMLLSGDLENPRTLLPAAAKADPGFAAPLYNQWRLMQRRHMVGGDAAAGEVDQGNSALAEAKQRDPSLAQRFDPPQDKLNGNQVMLVAPLPRDLVLELAKIPNASARVQSQMTQSILGEVPEVIAPFYPGVLALLFFLFGFLALNVEAARACNKCGRPVSQREDRELSKASQMCTQCINVFARKGVVPPSLKVRKQVEVARYQQTLSRASYVFGLLCSGMGHVFSGWPVRGAIYGFAFLFTVVMFFQRDGVLRVLYEGPPMIMKLLPLGVVFALVYLLSLRGLFRRQG